MLMSLMSVLCFENDTLLSLINVCKIYILNTKHIRTSCISRKVHDDRFWKIIIDRCWNSNNRLIRTLVRNSINKENILTEEIVWIFVYDSEFCCQIILFVSQEQKTIVCLFVQNSNHIFFFNNIRSSWRIWQRMGTKNKGASPQSFLSRVSKEERTIWS
jgi:hypothetical protein